MCNRRYLLCCLVYINNEYHGTYTVNIPKDNWMFGMNDDEGNKHAALMASLHSETVYLNTKMNGKYTDGWELEYCSTEEHEEGISWVANSFNDLIEFLTTSNDSTFKEKISDYTSVERTIDNLLYTSFICGGDNFAKNIVWLTYDGIKWIPSCYDMDGTWGMMYHGESYYQPTTFLLDEVMNQNNTNLLWKRVYSNFYPEIKERYNELKNTVLSFDNIINNFTNFMDLIPSVVKVADLAKWKETPRPDLNNILQIKSWAISRIQNFNNSLK